MNSESCQRVIDWDAQIDNLNYEDILGVSPDSSADECREAYYRFAEAFHPDAHPDAEGTLREALTRVFQRGVEAYRVLTDSRLRARWARERTRGQVRLLNLTIAPEVNLARELEDLHLHCRSAGAKLAAQKAVVSFAQGNFTRTIEQLERALEFESGANMYLAHCLDALKHANFVR